MARQTMRGVARLALLAVVPLAVSGCSYIESELDEVRNEAKQQEDARPRSVATPMKRAHLAPRTYHLVPGHIRTPERRSEPRTTIPLAPRPTDVEPKPDLSTPPTLPVQAPRSPMPVVVPAPAPSPAIPAPAEGQPRGSGPSVPPQQATPPPAVVPPAALPQPGPLPTQPGPPPPRQEPQPAPPNRANITPSRQSGGGIFTAARPDTAPRPDQAAPPSAPIVLSPKGPSLGETLSRSQLPARIDLARQLLQRGKVIEARIALQPVVRTFPAAGLHELARTYDPYYLGQIPRIDDGSEPRTAASLYEDAINHGATTAGNDLDRLRASYPALR